jgi:predicted RND superfamily exporter protein
LLSPDSTATNIVLQVDDTAPEVLLPRVEEVVASHSGAELEIVVSGVPAIVELIRRSLYRDLIVFSIAAVLVFALLIGLVYRDPAIVAGTLSTCLVAVGVTLLVVEISNIGIGLLTANLVTIVFVLTLSHVVFLTGNWRRAGASRAGVGPEGHTVGGREALLRQALADTWEGSFWSMATTLLGFTSLLIATARPLRELGVAGAVGSVTALVVAYLVYPAFLGSWARAPAGEPDADFPIPRSTGTRGVLPVAFVVVAAVAVGVPTVDTDPGLLSYFAEGSSLREGLARIDADGGSSTLDIVVTDPAGEAVSALTVYPRLEALQSTLEADAAVGVVLSPVVLIEHARTIPLAGLLPVRALLDIASSDALGGVGLGFVTPDGREARFALRMRETTAEARDSVTNRLRMGVEAAGLEPVVIAGLYDLQAQLGRLLASSLRIGIGGLLLLFAAVAVVVARAPRVAAAMWVCLAAIPLVILGTFGHAGVAMDIITSPAANIALAVGADSMIHLVVRVRRLGADGVASPWVAGVAQIGRPVLGATAIVCAGFGIFALSSFPPTQRFGFAVIVGTLTAAVMALSVLPRLACLRSVSADSLSAS